jgi:multiple sugar transport system ATP-binding protein
MAEIRLSGIDKVYPGGTHAVHSVDLHIADGEFMIMVGPSGCAKSTILRMIAGLETPTGGTLEIGGRVVNDVAPKDRDIAMVFQSYALYPHMTVRENMAFGLRLRKMADSEINARVADAARILGLEHLLDRLPKAMSGGQRQRVAMGRAIVREPQAFLMDEPLSNLDAKLRVQMRTEIAKLHQRLGTTTVYVTHDQVEALTLGQRICILRKGVVQQVNTPFQVYQNPANIFVGSFIGSPGMNFISGQLIVDGGAAYVRIGEQMMPLPTSVTTRFTTGDISGRQVVVGMRPEHMTVVGSASATTLPAHVELVEAMGAEQYVYFTADVPMPDLSALSDTQAMSTTFTARLDSSVQLANGNDVLFEFDIDEVHLFDPQSQLTLLAPIEEAAVRERQARRSGSAAPGQAPSQIRQPKRIVVANQPQIAIATSPLAPVADMPRPRFGGDAPGMVPGLPGMLPDANPQRVASIFEQAPPPPPTSPSRIQPAAAAVSAAAASASDAEPTAASPTTTDVPARRGFAARPIRPRVRLDEPDAAVEASGSDVTEALALDAPPAPAVAPAPPTLGDDHVAEVFDAAPQAPGADANRLVIPLATLRGATGTTAAGAPASAFRSALAQLQPQPASITGLPSFSLRPDQDQ